MSKIENPVDVLEILKTELPKCFRRGDEKLPLAIGIHASVLKHFESDERFDAKTLKKAIGLYCIGGEYINSIAEGAPRIDIKGNPVSSVQKPEEEYALKVLTERKERKQQSEMRKKERQSKVDAADNKEISKNSEGETPGIG